MAAAKNGKCLERCGASSKQQNLSNRYALDIYDIYLDYLDIYKF
jgi:hypothetical protein